MFREMRMQKRKMEDSDAKALLKSSAEGVLSVLGDDGYPYGVPVNYVYENDCIYFHCALEGHKLDAIKKYDKVSFTVISDAVVDQLDFDTYYQSVIAFGKASVVEDEDSRAFAFAKIMEKYSPFHPEEAKAYTEKHAGRALIVKIDVEHISGKKNVKK